MAGVGLVDAAEAGLGEADGEAIIGGGGVIRGVAELVADWVADGGLARGGVELFGGFVSWLGEDSAGTEAGGGLVWPIPRIK